MSEVERVSFDDEPLILVDADDQVVGHLDKAACHQGRGRLHRAFSVFLFDDEGRLLLQQRSAEKRLWPLFWSNTCCSHPRRGESRRAAAERRLGEEMALSSRLHLLYTFLYHAPFGDAGAEHELCAVFIGRLRGLPRSHPAEIADTRLLSAAALDGELAARPEVYTPWLHLEWRELRRQHWAAVEEL